MPIKMIPLKIESTRVGGYLFAARFVAVAYRCNPRNDLREVDPAGYPTWSFPCLAHRAKITGALICP